MNSMFYKEGLQLIEWIVILVLSFVIFIMILFAFRQRGFINKLKKQKSELEIENANLEGKIENLDWLSKAKDDLEKIFKSVASDVTQNNTENFFKTANNKLGDVLDPMKKELKNLQTYINEVENKREKAYGGLEKHLEELSKTSNQLQTGITKLSSSLRNTSSRGRWGEYQLRRIVELAGMTEHIDFEEQIGNEYGRPDMIIKLPKGGDIPVDAKTPMNAYLEAVEAENENEREEKLKQHVKNIKKTINDLSRKSYWEQFKSTPDFVIMFIPIEAAVSAAFEKDSQLLEEAIDKKVLITTPVTLLALLKSVAFGWQQLQLAENAKKIADEGKELYGRVSTFLNHMDNVGSRMKSLVQAYNDAVGSLESRLLPGARKFKDMVESEEGELEVESIDLQVRDVNAQELDEDNKTREP
ncbi:MAG: DNA recombination protein RmuC [Kosmotoga sp.]|nr:MAG: DNA recombination protein RmuC [Kosmotoga sp.]